MSLMSQEQAEIYQRRTQEKHAAILANPTAKKAIETLLSLGIERTDVFNIMGQMRGNETELMPVLAEVIQAMDNSGEK